MRGPSVWDLVGIDGIRELDLILYQVHPDEELSRVGVMVLYLGYYLPWDGGMNNIVSHGGGMHSYDRVIEGSVEDAGNLDDYRMGIHHYFSI